MADPTSPLVLDSSADLARFVYQGYSRFGNEGPITMAQAELSTAPGRTESVTLIGMSGLDLPRSRDEDQGVGIRESLIVGFGSDRNAYFREARQTILDNVPEGSTIVFAGHSLGGMVAQQLAADPTLQDRYDIRNTVTFGAPLIRPGQREGAVTRLGDAGDPVPLLSAEGTLLPFWNVLGLNRELTQYSTQGILAAHNDSYIDGAEWAGWDALGREGGHAALSVDPATIQSFAAPREGQLLEPRAGLPVPEPIVLGALADYALELGQQLAEAPPEQQPALLAKAQATVEAVANARPDSGLVSGDGMRSPAPELAAVRLAGSPDLGAPSV